MTQEQFNKQLNHLSEQYWDGLITIDDLQIGLFNLVQELRNQDGND